LWQGFGYDGYGTKLGYFGFSPDGRELDTPGRAQTQYDVETGSVLGTRSFSVTSRDQAWAREVVGAQVIDVASRSVLLEAGSFFTLQLSGDGRYLLWLDGDCAADDITIHRRAVDSDEGEALSLPGFCDGSWRPSLAVTATGDGALVTSGSGRLWHADLKGRTVSSIEAHPPLGKWLKGMSIALSVDERFVATVGSDEMLRTWSYPALEPVLAGLPVAWTRAFANCYCQPQPFAPVAWSADGSLLASPDESGHVVVRRACDGQILATLESPGQRNLPFPERPADLGPMFLAFAPSGAGLAVGWEAGLAYFALSAE
jgi:hypothetical protein